VGRQRIADIVFRKLDLEVERLLPEFGKPVFECSDDAAEIGIVVFDDVFAYGHVWLLVAQRKKWEIFSAI